MALPMPIPPWLVTRPAEHAQAAEAGLREGLAAAQIWAQANAESARLAEAQKRSDLAAALEREKQQQKSIYDAQSLAVDQAKNQANFSMAQARLKQTQESAVEKAQQWAQEQKRLSDQFAQTQARPASSVGKMQSDLAAARARGDTTAAQSLEAAIAESVTNKGRLTYMGMSDAGTPIMQIAEGGAKLQPTVGMQTQAQEKGAQLENAVQLINSIQRQLKPEHVGVAGAVGEIVADKGLAQLIPGAAVGDRIDSRTAIRILRSQLLRVVPDSATGLRSSVAEREEVDQAVPETGWHESYPDAVKKLSRLRKTLQDRAQVYSKAIGRTPPAWSSGISPEQIRDLVSQGEKSGLKPGSPEFKQKGYLTEDEAVDLLTRFY